MNRALIILYFILGLGGLSFIYYYIYKISLIYQEAIVFYNRIKNIEKYIKENERKRKKEKNRRIIKKIKKK